MARLGRRDGQPRQGRQNVAGGGAQLAVSASLPRENLRKKTHFRSLVARRGAGDGEFLPQPAIIRGTGVECGLKWVSGLCRAEPGLRLFEISHEVTKAQCEGVAATLSQWRLLRPR